MITYNSADVVEGALQSIRGLWDELLVGDGGSTDGTVEMVKKYGAKIIRQTGQNLGERKQELVEKAKGDWILVLDADEHVSSQLTEEIRLVTTHHKIMHEHNFVMPRNKRSVVAYKIPYQNYVFGGPVYYGGEKYTKVRLFRKGAARISPEPLHEEVIIVNKFHKARPSQRLRPGLEVGIIGEMRGFIHHHSYRTLWQLFAKFTQYAWVAAQEKKRQGETLSLKKLFLYGPHMFWARFVKEKGYKDGWRGLILALAFGYMEGLMYWLAFIKLIFIRPSLAKAKGVAFNTKKP